MFRSFKDVTVKEVESVNMRINDGYYCDLCEGGPWLSELDVEIHRKTNHRDYILKSLKDEHSNMCSICLRDQKDKESLIKHILVNHLYCTTPTSKKLNRDIYICDLCNHLFYNKQLLITHIFHWHKTDRRSNNTINCPKCRKFIRAKSVWFHLLYHGVYNIGTCPICLKGCENTAELIEHLKSHPGRFLCTICGYETTKECYFAKHSEQHDKKVTVDAENDVSRFFLPPKINPSLKNRMNNIFKGVPLTNEVRICILCRALCVSDEEMVQHIYGAHAPEVKVERKSHKCTCGEDFFNSVLLKQHIFKMKGDHGVWDGVSPTIQLMSTDEEVLYVFEIYNPSSDIVIEGPSEETNDQAVGESQVIIEDLEQMEGVES